jgi:ATP-dependent Clp protease adapter protein ClpS
MAESPLWLDVRETLIAESAADEVTILFHHDDVTPDHYMMLALQTIFGLSHELAEHITWVAHMTGSARVVSRQRDEAERLVKRAHAAARLHGFPLNFSLEQAVCLSEQDTQKSMTQFATSGILLLLALLLALSLAVADGAGDVAAPDMAPRPDAGITYEGVAPPCDAIR